MKDPIALFSAEWLVQNFGMKAVVLIRHPAAFAGSLKKAQWFHPFDHFLAQPLLMQRHLSDFESDIKDYVDHEKDIVDHAILLWNVIHHMISTYQQTYPEWMFVKHEELSRDPIAGFREIFANLNLEYSEAVKRRITRFSSAGQGREHALGTLKRHSQSNIGSWKTRLTTEEIERIREKTHLLAQQYYSDEDWVL